MAAKKRKPISSEDFYDISTLEIPRVHPGGNKIAYVRVTPEFEGKAYNQSIYVVDRRFGKPMQFTAGGTKGDTDPKWSPDGKNLAFVSTRGGKPQIYLIRLKGGEALPLTSMLNGAHAPLWSPDGKYIAFQSATRAEERREEDSPRKKQKPVDPRTAKRMEEDREYAEQQRIDPRVYTRTIFRQGTEFKSDRNMHIYIQKIKKDRPKRLTNGNFDYFSPAWSPDGKYIIASTKQHGDVDIVIRSDLVKIPVSGGEPEPLTTDAHGDFGAEVSPDNKWIYFLSFLADDLPRQRMIIRRIPFAGGTPESITGHLDFDISYFQLSPDGKEIFFSVDQEGAQKIMSIPADGSGDPREVISGTFMAGPFHIAGKTLAYRMESPDTPADLFCADLDGKNVKRLTHLNKKFLASRTLSIPEEVWIDRPDGFRIQGWIMLPHGYEPGKKYPWIVEVHGGPHIMWGASWWHEFQTMCGRGYGVFFCNPRGSDGYGGEFKRAIHRNWGGEDMNDILAGADLVVEKGLADPDRLYLTGGSFGGFMTAWIIGHDHRFKAAVAQRGVYNFISMYGCSDANTLIEWEFDTLPWDNVDRVWNQSPLKYVNEIQTPLMIIHSENDFRVGISQADELHTALRRIGKESELVRYPREGHELSRSGEPKHRVDRINKIIEWFDRHP